MTQLRLPLTVTLQILPCHIIYRVKVTVPSLCAIPVLLVLRHDDSLSTCADS